jgi:4-amino-4-deoxy-L-arabinose transferase-like glycosyltransferase
VKRIFFLFVCIFCLGAGVRFLGVRHPINRPDWRESDEASIARNYYREGMNLFLPRIDWRGDGPGYAEMEFPIYPWAIAVCYKLFGFHEIFGRVLAYILSLIGLGLFIQLARFLLPPNGAIGAVIFFAMSPLVVRIATSLQPEGLMLLCYIGAVYFFLRWLDDNTWRSYGLALGFTSFAILAKAPAAHLGLFFTVLVLRRIGLHALRQIRIWIFAAISLFPAALWYRYAHHLWLTYGNSLGVSNQYHWIGWDFFHSLTFLQGITSLEIQTVWMPAGLVVVLFALVFRKPGKAVSVSLYWLSAIFTYYIVTCRTTGNGWADYYHVVSAAPVAVLFGVGIEAIRSLTLPPKTRDVLIKASGVLAIVSGALAAMGFHLHMAFKLALLFVATSLVLVFLFSFRSAEEREVLGSWRSSSLVSLLAVVAAVCTAGAFLYEVRAILWGQQEPPAKRYACAQEFRPAVPQGVLIVASGGPCRDSTGYPVAYNASYFFYWMDQKGFNVCEEEQSIEVLRSMEKRGARYFVAEKRALAHRPGFEAELLQTFRLVQECDATYLFQLN